jgi:hypothetical protein
MLQSPVRTRMAPIGQGHLRRASLSQAYRVLLLHSSQESFQKPIKHATKHDPAFQHFDGP